MVRNVRIKDLSHRDHRGKRGVSSKNFSVASVISVAQFLNRLRRWLFVVLVGGDGFHQQVDQFLAVDFGGLGGVVHGDPVSKGRAGDGLDVARCGVAVAVQDGSGFRATDQRQDAARSGSPARPFVDDIRSFF